LFDQLGQAARIPLPSGNAAAGHEQAVLGRRVEWLPGLKGNADFRAADRPDRGEKRHLALCGFSSGEANSGAEGGNQAGISFISLTAAHQCQRQPRQPRAKVLRFDR
jgi:hypothetical protein